MKNNDLRTLTRLALLVAIELVMKAIGLGSVPMGPLYMLLVRYRYEHLNLHLQRILLRQHVHPYILKLSLLIDSLFGNTFLL